MSTKEGMPGITRFLCEKKADVNVKNDKGNTALHYAIGQKFYKLVDILTIFGAREDILNNKGYSPWELQPWYFRKLIFFRSFNCKILFY